MKEESKGSEEEVRELFGIYVREDLSYCDHHLIGCVADVESTDVQRYKDCFFHEDIVSF